MKTSGELCPLGEIDFDAIRLPYAIDRDYSSLFVHEVRYSGRILLIEITPLSF